MGDIGIPSPKVIQHRNMLTRKSFEKVLHDEQPLYLLLYKGTLTCIATSLESKKLSPELEKLLKEFEDVFPKKGPKGLPPLRGI